MEIQGFPNQEQIHVYNVRAACTAPRSGIATAERIPHAVEFSAPPEFNGIHGRWTPEHFFVASVATCFMSTFSGMAEASKLPFASFELRTEGTLTKLEDGWRFTGIRLFPTVVITREVDFDRTMRLLEKAEKNCLVARSIRARIEMKPTLKTEREAMLSQAS